nr:reverse transcriptase domain-containing protein [Tanacetum cinerariifolium]GEY91121.1 reverse transcriptase domain-containing protein [Tanacetum cinerariifolium]
GIIADLDADKDVTLKEVDASKDAEVEKNADVQPAELQEVTEVVTTAKLMTKVVTAATTTITAAPSAARKRKGKTKEWLEEEESKALKRKTKSFEEKVVKKQKLDEEVEELKKHLQIVPNDDDDVYMEATPLALKVLIVDYEIHSENNKPYYKIIRADGSHQLFLSFLSLLRNFDREDLELLDDAADIKLRLLEQSVDVAQLNELNELHDQAYKNSLIYKEKTKKLHDSKIKDRVFNVGDRVLLFNSRLKIFLGKLKTHWSGPLTITQVFPYGTVELSQTNGPNFKVNGHRLKHYFGEDIPKMVVPDLQTFPKD